MRETFLLGLDELELLCNYLPDKGVILLRGDLASGKTTLVQALAKHLGIQETITSPTFSILQTYNNKLFHYDIYQNKTQGFVKQGLHETLFEAGLHVVEWGDEEFEDLLQSIGLEYVTVDIEPSSEEKRYYRIENAQA